MGCARVQSLGATGVSDRPIRVAHVLSGDLWAGAEVATFHLVMALSRRDDIDVRVICLNEGTLVDRLRGGGIDVRILDESDLSFFELARRLRFDVADIDVLHSHRYKENALAALSGRRWVATHHGLPEDEAGMAALRGAFYRMVDRTVKRMSASRVIAVSAEVEAWLAAQVGSAKVVRIANGIDDPIPTRSPMPWEERPMRLGALGRLYPVKGFELAIAAVARSPRWELEIVGEGPERPGLERLVAQSGAADRIRLVGHEAEPLIRMARWRALLMTSVHEGNPISVLEALALGTPVVSGPLGGVRAILGNRGGWVLEDRDPETWARLLNSSDDFIQGGPARSLEARSVYEESYTADVAAFAVRQVYSGVLASG